MAKKTLHLTALSKIKTLYDFGQSITKIREAVNSMEIKGRQNSAYVVYVNHACDELIEDINEIVRKADASTQEPTMDEETDGDLNEQNSGPTE